MSTELLTPPAKTRPKPCAAKKPSRRETDRQVLKEAFAPANLTWKNIDWVTFSWMVMIHAGCIAAPFFFSWSALGVAIFLHWLTASIGICLGYHRYLSHRSFKLKSPAEFFVLLCGALSGEGSPLTWAATHRLHHQVSDEEGDPHSPLDGPWWSHLLWLFAGRTVKQQDTLFRRYVPDLAERPLMRFFEKTYGWWLIGAGVALYAVGGWSLFLWAMCVRMTVAYHSTWFVNSATHLWGYRNYETTDESRNLWWVAILSYGEGWHNNHHAHPSVAPAGHRWWEIDMTWWAIKALRALGLATDVREKIPRKMEG
jgi:stearoyl-CoA desaturase (delta-9 desaturase)